ncbi:molecular chaperone [Enterobacter asburiae]|nr:molecular chaperone [Enterobacter asburiae]
MKSGYKFAPTMQHAVILIISCFLLYTAQLYAAGISLGMERVIFNEGDNSVSVPVKNRTPFPHLINSRISADSKISAGRTPFFVSPPLFRLEGESEGVVRVSGDTRLLPKDRESVYYLTVTAIPSGNPLSRKSEERRVEGALSFSYGIMVKLFYRPAGLSSSAGDAAKSVHFYRSGNKVKIDNPSPYYVSFDSLKINGFEVKFDDNIPRMVPPFGSFSVPMKNPSPISEAGKVNWSAVVDSGNHVSFNGLLE